MRPGGSPLRLSSFDHYGDTNVKRLLAAQDDSDCTPSEQCSSVMTVANCGCDPFTGLLGCTGTPLECFQCEPREGYCESDAECGLFVCHESACVECVADSDCGDDEACDPDCDGRLRLLREHTSP